MMLLPVFGRGTSCGKLENAAEIGGGMIAAGFGDLTNGFFGEGEHLAGVFNADLI